MSRDSISLLIIAILSWFTFMLLGYSFAYSSGVKDAAEDCLHILEEHDLLSANIPSNE